MTIRIGCGPGVESRAVAELLHQWLAPFGSTAPTAFPDRVGLLKALANDRVDVVPEYAASLLAALNGMTDLETDIERTIRALRKELYPFGVVVSEPAAGRDIPALVMRSDRAAELGITSLGVLRARAGELRASGSLGISRQTWLSFGLTPGQPFASYVDDGPGGSSRLVAANLPPVDVVLSYSSDPDLATGGYLVFEPIARKAPADHIVVLVRSEAATAELLDAVGDQLARLTTAALIALNRRVVAPARP